MSEEFQEGWAIARLGELATKIGSGATPRGGSSAYARSGTPLIRSQNVYFDGFRDVGLVFLDDQQAAALDSVKVQTADVLLNITGASIGRACIAPERMANARVNQHVAIVRPKQRSILPSLLAMYLESPSIQLRINTEEYGVTRQALTKGWIEDLEIRVPPLPEQHRIVEKVEALLEQVNRAKERLDRVPLILKRFRQAVLAAACSGKLTNPDVDDDSIPNTWRRTSLDDLLPPGGLFDGPFGSSLKTSDYCAEGVRVIRLENVQQLRFVPEKETFISYKKYESLRKHTVGEGDIIFGSFVDETVRVCVLPRLVTPAIAKADCFCIRPRTDLVTKEYLAFQLACHRTRNALVEDIHGATRPRINTTQLRAVEIPLCPIEEQKEIGRQVQRLFTIADAIQLRLQTATARANKLPQAILSKAFSGELVPTEAELARLEGRTYETAEALLKRVTALGPDAPVAGKGRGRRARKAE